MPKKFQGLLYLCIRRSIPPSTESQLKNNPEKGENVTLDGETCIQWSQDLAPHGRNFCHKTMRHMSAAFAWYESPTEMLNEVQSLVRFSIIK